MSADLDYLIGTVSPSKLDTATQCLAKFAYSYVYRLPRGYSAALQIGNALDATGDHVYGHKMEHGTLPSAKDAREFFAAQWDYEAGAVTDWGKDTRGALTDIGTKGVGTWHGAIPPHVVPTATQRMIEVDVQDKASGDVFGLRGKVDMVGVVPQLGDRMVVTDLKSSGKRYAESKITKGLQPAAYTILTGIPTFEYHVVTRAKTPTVQILRGRISDDERDSFVHRAAMTRRVIEFAFRTGNWVPNRSHQNCSRKYCDHWATCEREHGGRVSP